MKGLSSCTYVLHRPLILIISRCCFEEDDTEIYQHVKRTCKACRVIVIDDNDANKNATKQSGLVNKNNHCARAFMF